MKNIILRDIRITRGKISYCFDVSDQNAKLFRNNELWIEYNEDMTSIPESILSIPFVSIMLPIMWFTDSVLWVNCLDRTFYNSVYHLQRAYQNLYRNIELKGRLVPAYLNINEINKSKSSVLLFSGGADAHTSYIRNRDRIKFLVNIQGFYNEIDERNNAAEADFRDISKFSCENGINQVLIKSNFAKILNLDEIRCYEKLAGDSLWHGFQHSMAFISIAIPIAYKYQISNIIIASSFTIGDSRVCASYPTTDNEFLFASNGLTIHDGFELNRQQKIATIVNYQKMLGHSYPIRVCSFNDRNCCECEKCFRTILGLVAEGANVRDFDFNISGSLKEHWEEVIYRRGGLMGFNNEKISHWPHIIERMKANYDKMTQEQKEFVDWFLNFDFEKAQKESRMRYYRQNFLSILKRKLGF